MKIIKHLIISVIFLIICINPVFAASDYYKDIVVNFNSNECSENAGKEVTIQLFADGEKVDGKEIKLNSETGYSYVFENLKVFEENSPNEIRYEVKVLEDGVYKLISPRSYSTKKERIEKWVQVLPEDIKPGHTYVITTDNWNVDNNGFSKVIYLRGDITAKGALVEPEYNLIDGKQSYYVINGEPIENTKWTVSSVPEDDPDYEEFKDYLVFTNESGKKLTLSGYNKGDYIDFIYKHSSKNGYIENEDAIYTNKVTLTYVPNSKGRFYIGTKNLYPEPNNMMQYLTLTGQNQYVAGSVMERAAQFKAFEYVEKDVELGTIEYIDESLCEKDYVVLDKNTEFKKTIDIDFNCDDCEERKKEGVTLQLFANGVKVDDGEITLNESAGFSYVFNNLPIFDETMKEIEYEVKMVKEDKYISMPSEFSNYEKITSGSWTQVMPNNIKPGNSYFFITENLNYLNNGFSRYIYLRGDITAKGANITRDLNITNGNKYYYSFTGEPIENTLWEVSNVEEDDENYSTFKDYLTFSNADGKKLTLTGYNQGDYVNFIYKHSSKDGYIDYEDAMYTNKAMIIPTNDSFGTFYIGTKNLYPEPNNMMQYIALSDMNQYVAEENIEYAAKFIAFEYTEEETIIASKMVIHPTLCEVLEVIDNTISVPNTQKDKSILELLLIIILMIILLVGTIYVRKNSKEK